MSKELEAFKTIYNNIDYLTSDVIIENDEVNDCLKTIKDQLLIIEQSLQRLETIDNAKPSEAFKGRITYGNNSDLKLYWDKSESYNCNCIVDLKVSNSSYIRNVLKREVVSPVCKDGYYVGGGYALKDLPLIYDRLQQYEDLGDLDIIKQALLKAQEQDFNYKNIVLPFFDELIKLLGITDTDEMLDKIKEVLKK